MTYFPFNFLLILRKTCCVHVPRSLKQSHGYTYHTHLATGNLTLSSHQHNKQKKQSNQNQPKGENKGYSLF